LPHQIYSKHILYTLTVANITQYDYFEHGFENTFAIIQNFFRIKRVS